MGPWAGPEGKACPAQPMGRGPGPRPVDHCAAGSGTPHGKCVYGVKIAELVVLHLKRILWIY
jgi:hypothetical protein